MDKRAYQRQYYQNEETQSLQSKQYRQRTAQLDEMSNTIVLSVTELIKFLDGKTTKTEVVNQLKSISTPDVDKVVTAISKLDKDILSNKLDIKPLKQGLDALKRELSLIPKSLPKIPEQKDAIKVTNLNEVTLDTTALEKAINGLKLDPKIEVKPTDVKVEQTDFKPLQKLLLDVIKAVKAQKYPEFPKIDIPKTDLSKVEKKLDEHKKLLKEIVDKPVGGGGGGGGGSSFTDAQGKSVYVTLNPDGSLPVTAAINNTLVPTDPLIEYVVQDEAPNDTGASYYGFAKIDGTYLIMERDKTSVPYTDRYANIGNNATRTTYQLAWTNRATLTFDYIFNLTGV